MRILVLGGTKLVGRGFVEAALEAGHEITLFHRGLTHPDRFPAVERVLGDRDGDLSELRGRTWDVVFDPSASQPHRVETAVAALRGRVGRYLYVSSVSVYAGPSVEGEGAARAVWDGSSGPVTEANYGGYKARCEDLVAEAFADHALLRLGLVIGPYDESQRFNVWVRRAARGGEILAPGPADAPVQLIDGRDVGAFALARLEAGVGPYNVVGPTLTMAEALDAVARGVGAAARFTWAPYPWLIEQGVKPWEDLPLWTAPEDRWLWRVGTPRAPVPCRPLADSVRDALAWEQGRAEPTTGGLSPEREAELLAAVAAERQGS